MSGWYSSPDQVGGWKTATENLSNNQMSPLNQNNFVVDPVDYQVNDIHPQYYPLGLQPLGLDITNRALIGVKPYG
jgi:hypothetical protein